MMDTTGIIPEPTGDRIAHLHPVCFPSSTTTFKSDMERTMKVAMDMCASAFFNTKSKKRVCATRNTNGEEAAIANRNGRTNGERCDGERGEVKPTDATKADCVVVDGQNVGCAFGGNTGADCFRAEGVKRVLDYYENRGVTAVAFLPRARLKCEKNSRGRSNQMRSMDKENNEILRVLRQEGRVALVETGTHDDYYIIRYAIRAKGDIISNDKFRDEEMIQKEDKQFCKLKTYFEKHVIHYTFVRGEFLPNPDPTQLCLSVHYPRTKKGQFCKKDSRERRCCKKHKAR